MIRARYFSAAKILLIESDNHTLTVRNVMTRGHLSNTLYKYGYLTKTEWTKRGPDWEAVLNLKINKCPEAA